MVGFSPSGRTTRDWYSRGLSAPVKDKKESKRKEKRIASASAFAFAFPSMVEREKTLKR